MNYRKIGFRTLEEFVEENPEMTLGEVLYSIVRKNNSKIEDTKDLKSMSDEQVYSMICKAKHFEKE